MKQRAPVQHEIQKALRLRARYRREMQWGRLAEHNSELMARWPLMAAAISHHEHKVARRTKWAFEKRRQRMLQYVHHVGAAVLVPIFAVADAAGLADPAARLVLPIEDVEMEVVAEELDTE